MPQPVIVKPMNILPKSQGRYYGTLFLLCLLRAGPAYSGPQIYCAAPQYEFGTRIGGQSITNDFILTNRGNEPVVISKIKDCCGVQSSINPWVIEPGSNIICRSVFDTRSRHGRQIKQILIASNDSRHPYFELKMTGTLIKPVEVAPGIIRCGTVLEDDASVYTLTATNLTGRKVELLSVTSGVKGLEASVDSKTDESAAGQRSWAIRVQSVPPLDTGKRNGTIVLNFSTGAVKIPVLGTVDPVIQAVPDRIRMKAGADGLTERLIMLRSGDKRAFEVVSCTLEGAEGSVQAIRHAQDRWSCKLAVRPGSVTANARVRVEISCGSRSEIQVPLLVGE